VALLVAAVPIALAAPRAAGSAPAEGARAPGGRSADPAGAARSLEARLNAVRALSARFTQTLESAALPSAQVEKGRVYLQRPGRMRWEYDDPPGKLAVADGERSWLYLPEDRQVLVAPLPDARHDQGIGLLLRERLDLLAEFEPDWGPAPEGGGAPSLLLRPRAPQASFDRLVVDLDATNFPIRLTVVDPLGGSVTYRLMGLRFADRLDEDLFRFAPPPGLSVQELAP
jgi:outer membrane lipoprotein carrier protein